MDSTCKQDLPLVLFNNHILLQNSNTTWHRDLKYVYHIFKYHTIQLNALTIYTCTAGYNTSRTHRYPSVNTCRKFIYKTPQSNSDTDHSASHVIHRSPICKLWLQHMHRAWITDLTEVQGPRCRFPTRVSLQSSLRFIQLFSVLFFTTNIHTFRSPSSPRFGWNTHSSTTIVACLAFSTLRFLYRDSHIVRLLWKKNYFEMNNEALEKYHYILSSCSMLSYRLSRKLELDMWFHSYVDNGRDFAVLSINWCYHLGIPFIETIGIQITDSQSKYLPHNQKKKHYYDVKWTNTKSFKLHELIWSPKINTSFDTRIVTNAKWENRFKITLYN